MRFREIIEGEVVGFKPKRRALRHFIEILKLARKRNPWTVFVQGQYFNAFKTEAEAEKVATAKEKEFDRFYESGNIRFQIIKLGNEYALLDRGVSLGIYGDYTTAEKKADELLPGSTERMISSWYR